MDNVFKVLGIGCAGGCLTVFIVTFGFLGYIGTVGPETSVYTGNQLPSRFLNTVKSLNLLEKDEKIKYFYSDALTDIEEGLYFVTDKHLVLYSKEWETPAQVIPLHRITSVDAEYDDSFLSDTTVYITTADNEFWFPVSSEGGKDKRFVEAILSVSSVSTGAADNSAESDMAAEPASAGEN